jgi:RNA polymerase sigma-70 factor, ECF subfamily
MSDERHAAVAPAGTHMNSESKTDEFVALYTNSQRRIYAYIRSQVLSPADADDVLQDTSAVLWRKFADFQAGTDFTRWACRVARLEVLTYHRHHKRLLTIFTDEVADAIGEKILELSDTVLPRAEALADCAQLLSPRDREVLTLRYQSNQSISQIAQGIKRTESAVYKSLQRIHDELYECIENALSKKSKS